MTENNVPATIELINPDDTVKNKIFVTIHGQDWQKDYEDIGLSFDSSEREIMDTLAPIMKEEFDEDITNLYKVRKATNNQNIFVIPNSTAGNYSKCPICGYYAFNGRECFDCGYTA